MGNDRRGRWEALAEATGAAAPPRKPFEAPTQTPAPRPGAFWTRMAAPSLGPPRAVTPDALAAMGSDFVTFVFGWFFACFGMLFVIVFRPLDAVSERWAFAGETVREPAVVRLVEKTNLTVNDRRVWRAEATVDRAGREAVVTSYSFGRPRLKAGRAVDVESPPGDPGGGRIRGLRRSPADLGGLFVLLFPAAGLAMVGWRAVWAVREARLYRHGVLAVGRVGLGEWTATTINGRRVRRYHYQFEAADGSEATGQLRTHAGEGPPPPPGKALVLYLPERPWRSLLVARPEAAPHGLRVDAGGRVRGGPMGLLKAVAWLAMAAVFAAEVAFRAWGPTLF